jgi:hypothetical protein
MFVTSTDPLTGEVYTQLADTNRNGIDGLGN